MTAGLRADSDLMIWRMSKDPKKLQDLSARTLTAGMGTYFKPVRSFIGVCDAGHPQCGKKTSAAELKDSFGRYRYMVLHPVTKTRSWYAMPAEEREKVFSERAEVLKRYGCINENFFSSYGIDGQEFLVQREADDINDLISVTQALREQRNKEYTACDTPLMLCIGRDLTEILDLIS